MPFAVRKPNSFLVDSFALPLNPSTAPDEMVPRARNQLMIRCRCRRRLRAIFFIGPIRLRMVRVHQASRNFTAHSGLLYSQNRWKSWARHSARSVPVALFRALQQVLGVTVQGSWRVLVRHALFLPV